MFDGMANYENDEIFDDLNDDEMDLVEDRGFNVRDIADLPANLSEEIREHPLRSIAIAVGAGYLLSKIL